MEKLDLGTIECAQIKFNVLGEFLTTIDLPGLDKVMISKVRLLKKNSNSCSSKNSKSPTVLITVDVPYY